MHVLVFYGYNTSLKLSIKSDPEYKSLVAHAQEGYPLHDGSHIEDLKEYDGTRKTTFKRINFYVPYIPKSQKQFSQKVYMIHVLYSILESLHQEQKENC